MDRESDHGEHEVKTPEDNNNLTSSTNGKEGVPAVMEASHHGEENSSAPVEASSSESGDPLPSTDSLTTSKHLHEDSERPVSHVEFDISDGDGRPMLHLETSESEGTTSPAQEEEKEAEEEEIAAASPDPTQSEGVISEEDEQLLWREQCEERDKALKHNSQLKMKLAKYLSKKSRDTVQLETLGSGQLQEYGKSNILTDMKQQLASDLEVAQQEAEELRLQSQEKSDKVEKEWKEFVALKQDVAVTVLSQYLGKRTAQTKVESTLASEQHKQDKLIKLWVICMKLKMRIHRLEAELRGVEDQRKDPVQLLIGQLHAARLEHKKLVERQNEESIRLQNRIRSSLEVLSNVKEKLFWSQREVQAKREQLAEVEAIVARKREVLTTIKNELKSLQRDIQRLKESQGILGNRLLLRDFEDTVNACDHLEEQLENLKRRISELLDKMEQEPAGTL
ncbi:coiled-coil domain-containing protein 96 [Hippoglossus hippoglossus]|uniref:coiled-coil domain-containing protein 96 n=1 Tax=Hippoglossus hippoglossus TaxID=8267 RepID=UPI00148C459B|nr:coiled-coil domain-containing protein 96 [Hippoglossus hippoglossus]